MKIKVGEVMLVVMVVVVTLLVIDTWVKQQVELSAKALLKASVQSPQRIAIEGFASGVVIS
jgi:hypothetical protein